MRPVHSTLASLLNEFKLSNWPCLHNAVYSFSYFTVQGIADRLVLLDLSEETKGGVMDLDIFSLPNVEISRGMVILLKRCLPHLFLYLSPRIFFNALFFFRTVLSSQATLSRRFPVYIPYPCTRTASPIIKIPHQSGTVDEPTLTHHYHPKSIVYITVHSCCCTFCGCGQIYNDTYLPL